MVVLVLVLHGEGKKTGCLGRPLNTLHPNVQWTTGWFLSGTWICHSHIQNQSTAVFCLWPNITTFTSIPQHSSNNFWIHPRKLTNVPLKWDHFSREYIFQPLIFMGHSLVFRGGTLPSPPVLRNATSFELGDEGGLRHHRWIPLSFGEGYEAKRKKSKRYYLPHDVAKWWIHMVESTN